MKGRKLGWALLGLLVTAALAAIGYASSTDPYAADKRLIAEDLKREVCGGISPCQVAPASDPAWKMSKDEVGTVTWQTWVDAPRTRSEKWLKRFGWLLTGETRYNLRVRLDPDPSMIEKVALLFRGGKMPPRTHIEFPVWNGEASLDKVEQNWRTEKFDNLRMEIWLTLAGPQRPSPPHRDRALALLIRLEAERGSPAAAAKLASDMAVRFKLNRTAIKAESENLAKNNSLKAEDRERFRLVAATL